MSGVGESHDLSLHTRWYVSDEKERKRRDININKKMGLTTDTVIFVSGVSVFSQCVQVGKFFVTVLETGRFPGVLVITDYPRYVMGLTDCVVTFCTTRFLAPSPARFCVLQGRVIGGRVGVDDAPLFSLDRRQGEDPL